MTEYRMYIYELGIMVKPYSIEFVKGGCRASDGAVYRGLWCEVNEGFTMKKEAELLRGSGKKDRSGNEIYEGDIITLLDGTLAQVCYGEFDGYCPYDKIWMSSIGFYVTGISRYQCPMPLGPTEEYASIQGNIYANPELLGVKDDDQM